MMIKCGEDKFWMERYGFQKLPKREAMMLLLRAAKDGGTDMGGRIG